MNILVTGAAGFIGASVANKLIEEGHNVTGLDNLNNYYDPSLKTDRLGALGIRPQDIHWLSSATSEFTPSFRFIRMNQTP